MMSVRSKQFRVVAGVIALVSLSGCGQQKNEIAAPAQVAKRESAPVETKDLIVDLSSSVEEDYNVDLSAATLPTPVFPVDSRKLVSAIRNADFKRGEYEKTVDYDKRIGQLIKLPLYDKVSLDKPVLLGEKNWHGSLFDYDPDTEMVRAHFRCGGSFILSYREASKSDATYKEGRYTPADLFNEYGRAPVIVTYFRMADSICKSYNVKIKLPIDKAKEVHSQLMSFVVAKIKSPFLTEEVQLSPSGWPTAPAYVRRLEVEPIGMWVVNHHTGEILAKVGRNAK